MCLGIILVFLLSREAFQPTQALQRQGIQAQQQDTQGLQLRFWWHTFHFSSILGYVLLGIEVLPWRTLLRLSFRSFLFLFQSWIVWFVVVLIVRSNRSLLDAFLLSHV